MASQAEAASALRPDTRSGRRRVSLAWLGIVPFFAYALAFLLVPAGEVIVGAFKSSTGGATTAHIHQLLNQPLHRTAWREAASNLGASSWQFWRYVGIPVLLPSILGAFILLFGNSFSAYATAYGIAANGISIVPITIGFYYSGNVLYDPHFAEALAFGMFVVLAAMMLLYLPLQRRSARWMR